MANPYQRLDGQPGEQYPPPYNPAYPPQQGYAPQYQAAPPQYPGGGYQNYAQPPAYGGPTYAAPQQAVVVNVTNTQSQSAPTPRPTVVQPTTVFLGRNYENDVGPALIIFIVGFFCWCVWAAGFRYIRSKSVGAKVLGILSVVLFFSWIIIAVVWVTVVMTAVDRVAHNTGGTSSYSTTYTMSVSSFSQGYYSIYVPTGYSTVSVSASGSATWQATSQGYYTDADGYSGVTCNSASCPYQYGNLMALVGKCGSYGSVTLIGDSYSSMDVSTCSYLYLGYNDLYTNSHSGYMSVTVTWYP